LSVSVQLAAVKRFDKPAVVEFFDIAVVHEVRRFDVGRLRIALADEIDDGLQALVTSCRSPSALKILTGMTASMSGCPCKTTSAAFFLMRS
jgi:hypothetical protein